MIIDDQPAIAAVRRCGSAAGAAQVHTLMAADLLHAHHSETSLAAAIATCDPTVAKCNLLVLW